MITGIVNANREATIRLIVCGVRGQEQEIEAVIDTGFSGFLSLPSRLIVSLRLSRRASQRPAQLAPLAPKNYEVRRIWGYWE